MSMTESLSEPIDRSGIDALRVTVSTLQQALSSGSLTSTELIAFYRKKNV